MSRTPTPANAADTSWRTGGTIVLIVEFGILLHSVFDGQWNARHAPVPFAWRDVAVVHALCALPLAAAVTALISTHLPSWTLPAIAIGCLVVGTVPFLDGLDTGMQAMLLSRSIAGLVVRPFLALVWVLATTLSLAVLLCNRRPAALALVSVSRKSVVALVVLGVSALTIPPATYVAARSKHDLVELGSLVDQSRLGEASQLATGLTILDASSEWNGHPVSEIAEKLRQIVNELEASLVNPLRGTATARERIERGRTLAMLGHTDDALNVLSEAKNPTWTPEVESLRGTILETRGDWEDGLTAYSTAKQAWEFQPPSPMRQDGMIRLTTGIAYCLRKSGRYSEAEAAYEELLSLSPTAGTHFLLAQFYEDSQQAAKARLHARHAMELDPERYSLRGEKLIQKLTLNQFGCFGVFNAGGNVEELNSESLQRVR